MEPKQSARELLREARAELAKAHDHLMELTAKLPMQYFGLVDGNIIQAEGCFVDKIDAYLAAPSESAMEVVGKIREDSPVDNGEYIEHQWAMSGTEAAALIEFYGRRVPRAIDAIAGKLEEAIGEEDWNEAKSVLNDLWDLRDDGYKVEG